jgi:WD40 repeat protein
MRSLLLSLLAIALASATNLPAQQPARPAAPRLDNYGDPLPPGAVLRLGTTRLQTCGGFGWMPDGKSLVTLKDGTVYFWDMADGHCHQTLLVPVVNDRAEFALSRDGKRLAATDGKGGVAIWDLENTKLTAAPQLPPGSRVENASPIFAPDGLTFVTTDTNAGEMRLWDSATCEVRRTSKLAELRRGSSKCAYSPDGTKIAISSFGGGSIFFVDPNSDEPPTVIRKAHSFTLECIAFTPDGKRLFSTGTAKLPAAADGTPQWRTEVHIWDVAEQRKLGVWPLPDGMPPGCGLAFSSTGEQMVTIHKDRILVWDTARQSVIRTIDGLAIRNPSLASVAVDAQDKFVAVADHTNYVRIWELATGKPHLSTDQHHQGNTLAVAWSPNGRQIATGDMLGEVCLWDAETGRRSRSFRGPEWGVWHLVLSRDGSQLILGGDEPEGKKPGVGGSLRWHESSTGKLLREHPAANRVRHFSLSPNGQVLALQSMFLADAFAEAQETVELLSSQTGAKQGELRGHRGRLVAMGWSAERKEFLSLSQDTSLVRTNVAKGQVVAATKLEHLTRDPRTGELIPGSIAHAVFQHAGDGVVSCGGLQEIYGWNVESGAKRWTIASEARWIRGLALSPDERVVACIASDGDNTGHTLRLYSIAAQKELVRFDLGRELCDRAVFSPDGNRIAVGFYDGTALVYDVSAAWNKVE